MKALYPGSFDPVTNGHIDIIERAAQLFDEVVVAVSHNIRKKYVFSVDERLDMLRQSISHLAQVSVSVCPGLTADFAKSIGAGVIIRGLRALSDFEMESNTALMNKHLNPQAETIFLMPREDYLFLNSTIIREIASFGGNVQEFVTPYVAGCLRNKYNPGTIEVQLNSD